MRSIVIGTAGHIDHGKSALVRALTGTDPDRLKEEQERGITIDLGFAHLDRGDLTMSFVDVPGHERFVKNMLAGAGGIDMVLLVVAADESVMPQTREHFDICRLLQIRSGVIALTKCDLVDQEMRELAMMETRELVRDSFLAHAPIVPVSARTGDGLEDLLTAIATTTADAATRRVDGAVRLPIDRVFSARGFGTVVTGTLVSGTIANDQELSVLPVQKTAKVRGLQVHGSRVNDAGAGQRVAVNIGGIDVDEIARGDTLSDRHAFDAVRRVDVALDLLTDAVPLKHGTRVRFHSGTSEVLGRVAVAAPRREGEMASIFARIRLESPAVLTRGDRFIIRSYSPIATIGGGVILDPFPPRGAIRTDAGIARVRRLEFHAGDQDAAIGAFVEERGPAGFPRRDLQRRAGLTAADAEAAVARLTSNGAAAVVDDVLIDPKRIDALSESLVRVLRAHHAANPLSDGMPREEARDQVFRRTAPGLFDHVVERLSAASTVSGRERLAVRGHQVSLTPEEQRVHDDLERTYRKAGLTPPDLAGAAAAIGASAAAAERMAALLARSRTLVRLDTMYFHAAALETLKAEVRALKSGTGAQARVDVASFKARYGITRKFAIPLLEYLDRERVTRRVGEARIVL